ncbi:PopZ family protein [Aurantimonas sp.]|uniref:PopZ family protein n=1 Tax=Aurantimonas sp. TaxID=1872654 RepID=UPI003518BCD6
MSNALPAREPSMDEILASIRRIIESGEEKSPSRRAAAKPAVSAERDEPQAAEPATRAQQGTRPALTEPRLDRQAPVQAERDEVSGFDGLGRPANDTVRQAPRPKLGIVPPVAPVAADEDSEDDAAMSSGPGLSLDMVEDEVETAVRQAVAAHDGRLSNAADATDADILEDVTALSSARLQAASLAAASERRTDAARDSVADVSAMAATDDEDEVPAEARLEPAEAMASAQAAPMPTGSTSDADVSADADEPADYLGEFDEDEFASELLDRAGLFEAGRADADVATDSVASNAAEDEDDDAAAPTMTARPSPQAYEPAEVEAQAAEAVDAPAAPSAPVAATTAADIHALVSHEAGERIAGSFDDLARVIRDEQMRTMDETVRQMLRPMLQEWLDDNLPRLVERLVREEIERVARGGRR